MMTEEKIKNPTMTANPILLQKKYTRVIGCFAKQQGLSLDEALGLFYRSEVYQLMRDGVLSRKGATVCCAQGQNIYLEKRGANPPRCGQT